MLPMYHIILDANKKVGRSLFLVCAGVVVMNIHPCPGAIMAIHSAAKDQSTNLSIFHSNMCQYSYVPYGFNKAVLSHLFTRSL